MFGSRKILWATMMRTKLRRVCCALCGFGVGSGLRGADPIGTREGIGRECVAFGGKMGTRLMGVPILVC